MINKNQIKHVAELSKLSFNDQDLEKFSNQFSNILNMVNQLNEVNTDKVPEMMQATDLVNIMREDIPKCPTNRKELMKNVPDKSDGFIKVPAIMEKEG